MRERFALRYASLIGNPANAWARNGTESPPPFAKSDAVCSCARKLRRRLVIGNVWCVCGHLQVVPICFDYDSHKIEITVNLNLLELVSVIMYCKNATV